MLGFFVCLPEPILTFDFFLEKSRVFAFEVVLAKIKKINPYENY